MIALVSGAMLRNGHDWIENRPHCQLDATNYEDRRRRQRLTLPPSDVTTPTTANANVPDSGTRRCGRATSIGTTVG